MSGFLLLISRAVCGVLLRPPACAAAAVRRVSLLLFLSVVPSPAGSFPGLLPRPASNPAQARSFSCVGLVLCLPFSSQSLKDRGVCKPRLPAVTADGPQPAALMPLGARKELRNLIGPFIFLTDIRAPVGRLPTATFPRSTRVRRKRRKGYIALVSWT